MIIAQDEPFMRCGECETFIKEGDSLTVMQIRGDSVVVVHNTCLESYMKRINGEAEKGDILAICHYCLKPVRAKHEFHAFCQYPHGAGVGRAAIPSDGNGIIVMCSHVDCRNPNKKQEDDEISKLYKDVF